MLGQLRGLGGGSIITISSIYAHLARAGTFPCAAAKAGVLGLTRSRSSSRPTTFVSARSAPAHIRFPPVIAQYESRPDSAAAWDGSTSCNWVALANLRRSRTSSPSSPRNAPASSQDLLTSPRGRLRVMLDEDLDVDAEEDSYNRLNTSCAARLPARTAPSMYPVQYVAVSVPAQCTRATGWRICAP